MTKYFIIIIYLCSSFIFPSHAFANYTFNDNVPLRGQYEYEYLGFDVYDIMLFMKDKCVYPNCNFSLKITYKRAFDKHDIIERSIDEISHQNKITLKIKKHYRDILTDILPNVKTGDTIEGKMSGGYAEFYHNNQFIGKINDKVLSVYFFDIWLSDKTSEPKMRQALLNK